VVVIVLAVIVIAAIALFVIRRSDNDGGPGPNAFTNACVVVDSPDIADAVGYPVGPPVPAANVPPLSGCAFAADDPANPAVGVIITDQATSQDTFDRELLAGSYSTVESVPNLGKNAFYVARDTSDAGGTEGLLVVTDGDKGVEVAINGPVSADEAFDLARPVAELYVDRLELG
jgi:hypothetical protein